MEAPILKKPLKKPETFTFIFKKPTLNKIELKINDKVTIKNVISIPDSYKDKIFTIKNIFNNHGIISNGDTEVSVPLELLKKVEKENIKVDDKVVLRTDIAFQVPFPITKGTILNVDLIENDKARVSTDKVSFVVPLDFLIKVGESEKEIKKEDVRVVRKLEDLDGLENGMGLIMKYGTEKVLDIEQKTLSILVEHNLEILYKVDIKIKTSLKHILEIAKSMGFKFEHKPLRTEEIMHDLIEKEFKFGEGNFLLIKLENGKWDYINNTSYYLPDKKYYTLESVKRVVKELNELLESENNV